MNKCPKCGTLDLVRLGVFRDGFDFHCTDCQIDIRDVIFKQCTCTNPALRKIHCKNCGHLL